jgi:hypothetical protein
MLVNEPRDESFLDTAHGLGADGTPTVKKCAKHAW